MKPLKVLGVIAAIAAMSGLMGLVGSVLAQWDAPATPRQEMSSTWDEQQSQSNFVAAAVASAQEATSLTQ
jgi:hypothetical protein